MIRGKRQLPLAWILYDYFLREARHAIRIRRLLEGTRLHTNTNTQAAPARAFCSKSAGKSAFRPSLYEKDLKG